MFLKTRFAAILTVALTVVSVPAYCAEPTPPPPTKPLPKTLAEQVTYLEGALSESIRTRDFALFEMALNGFKAAKLAEKDLEISLLRAERDAAWANSQQFGAASTPSASLETWGLMARAKLGQVASLAVLHQLAFELPPALEPLHPLNTLPPAEFQARQTAQAAFTAKVKQRDYAILALALMEETGIEEKALAAIQNRVNTDAQGMGFGYGASNPLILAVLRADPNGGFGKLIAYCSDEKYKVKDQSGILSELNSLASQFGYMGADDKFSITGEIRKNLPKDAQQQLVGPFISLLKRYTPDPNQPWDMTLNAISNIGNMLPAKSLTQDGIDALDALVAKLPGPKEQYPKQSFIAILKKNGKDVSAPVKPPKPPAEDKQF